MKPRVAIGVALAAFVMAGVALLVRVQEAGQARVVRRGEEVQVLRSRVGFVRSIGGEACSVGLQDSALRYDGRWAPLGPAGLEYELEWHLWYEPPAVVPDDWPRGNWCRSFETRLRSFVERWLSTRGESGLLALGDRAGEELASELRRSLEADGLVIRRAGVDLVLPAALAARQPLDEVVAGRSEGRPVIVVGLDGGDWSLLDRYIADGRMPNLARLVAEGTRGTLVSEYPPLSPLLWTTMMTGRSPLEHGILDFSRLHPDSGRIEPITSDERLVPAIWNMATAGGRSVAVFGLWATYPAELVNGIMVSDRLFSFLFSEDEPPPSVVFPASFEPRVLATLEAARAAVGYQQLREFLPWLSAQEYEQHHDVPEPYRHPISALRQILVETEVYHRLSTEYLAEHQPDLAIVYVQGTDSVGHTFASYAPPKLDHVSAADFERYASVPRLYFERVDELLGDYLRLAADRDATLLLVSDHGFLWQQGRPIELSSSAKTTAAHWHREEGIYLLWNAAGPGAVDGVGASAGIRQVTSTLLALLGLPPAEGVAGPPIGGIRSSSSAPVGYDDHYTPAPTVSYAFTDQAALDAEIAKLRALGYVGGDSSPSALGASGSTVTAGAHSNRGLILQTEGRIDEAIAAFEEALKADPSLTSAMSNFSNLLFAERRDPQRSSGLLASAYAGGVPQGLELVIQRAIGYERSGAVELALDLLSSAIALVPGEVELWLFRGRFRFSRQLCREALVDFEQAAELAPRRHEGSAGAAMAALCVGDQAGALAHANRSLALNPEQPALDSLRRQLEGSS